MGRGIELKCSKCRYSFGNNFGVGFLFPQTYQETMEAARKGKLGKDVQSFLVEHPDGALDCDQVLLQCTSCSEMDRGMDLTMYVPKDKSDVYEGEWSIACSFGGVSYVAPWVLKEQYRLVKPYDHVCRKCGKKMRIIKEEDLVFEGQEYKGTDMEVNVNCPKCHKPMVIGGCLMWD